MKKISILLTIILVFSFSFYLYYREGSLPVNKTVKSTKIFVVSQGAPLQEIVSSLSKEDLIRNKLIFYFIVKKLGLEKSIQAGDFRLSPSMSAQEIAKALTHGTLDVWVTLIEGTRKEEMAQVISKELDIPETEFIKYASEGYLFPDTYLLPKEATAGSVINILENNFRSKFDADLENQAKAKELSKDEVVILASLVEKEEPNDEERPAVAGIILKRLQADWPLQIDATVQYALGYQSEEKSWWKKELSLDDLKVDSEYNTYKNKGLPPAPIANPGLASIKAVIEADTSTPYWYYLHDKKGVTHYAKTIEEHNANIRKYLR